MIIQLYGRCTESAKKHITIWKNYNGGMTKLQTYRYYPLAENWKSL